MPAVADFQSTLIKTFEHDPRVVIALMSESETREILEETFRNVYLRGPMFFDPDGSVARDLYDQPATTLPFARGFLIGPDGTVELPIFGYDPDRLIAEIQALVDQLGPLGDLNGDGVVDNVDLLALLAQWGPCPPAPAPCPADLNGDGVVSSADLLVLLQNWS